MQDSDESPAIKEYRLAFDEFFKDKPKDEAEYKKRLHEFFHWYNNVRKQSDTGKTPAEMYKEAYGVEAPEPAELSEEDIKDEEIDELREFFDNELWSKMKKDLKDATKKEACFACFLAGTEVASKWLEEDIKNAEKAFEGKSPEEIGKIIKEGKTNNKQDE